MDKYLKLSHERYLYIVVVYQYTSMRTIQARRKLGPQGTMRRSLADVLRDAKHCIEALESRDMDGLGTELENLKADVAVVQGVFEELHAATLKV